MSFLYFLLILLPINIIRVKSFYIDRQNFFTPEMQLVIHQIYTIATTIKYRPLINHYCAILRSYINTHEICNPKISRKDFIGSRQIIRNFSIFEDGTYDFLTEERLNFNTGYQVSFETAYDNYTEKEYDELVYKFALMDNNKAYIGVYQNIPEISFFYDRFDFAYVIAIAYNQIAIWDWEKNTEIFNPFHEDKNIDEIKEVNYINNNDGIVFYKEVDEKIEIGVDTDGVDIDINREINKGIINE